MERTVKDVHEGIARLQDLPYDLLRAIFYLLGDNDVVNVINTCNSLRATFEQDESVWKELSARYGVTDSVLFEGRSFRTIFLRLLHKYGALLGLWASDHPFRGNILEFRLAPNRWGPGQSHILVGELWRFVNVWNEEPQQPRYLECVQIGFGLFDSSDPDEVTFSFNMHEEMARAATYHRAECWDTSRKPELKLISAYHSPMTLQSIVAPMRHPDFPSSSTDPWYDQSRSRPRLAVMISPNVDSDVQRDELGNLQWGEESNKQEEAVSQRPRHLRSGFLARTRAPVPKPLAFYMSGISRLPPGELLSSHMPLHGFADKRLSADPRYYPLKQDIRLGVNPSSTNWMPESLEGLWLGSYGPHGTECLYVYLDAPARTVRAIKMTGDVNVPRGIQTWEMRLDSPRSLESLQQERIPVGTKAFDGFGTISEHGFTHPESIRATVMVVGRDEIRVDWFSSHVNIYVRYTGRQAIDTSTTPPSEDPGEGQW